MLSVRKGQEGVGENEWMKASVSGRTMIEQISDCKRK